KKYILSPFFGGGAVARWQQGHTLVAGAQRYGCFGGVGGVILAAQQLGVVMSFLSSRSHRRHIAALAGAASLLSIAFASPAFAQGTPAATTADDDSGET